MKKFVISVIAGCMVFVLAGCGGKGNAENTASSKEYVYKKLLTIMIFIL